MMAVVQNMTEQLLFSCQLTDRYVIFMSKSQDFGQSENHPVFISVLDTVYSKKRQAEMYTTYVKIWQCDL